MNAKIQVALFKAKISEIETLIKEFGLEHKINKEFLRHLSKLSQHFSYNLSVSPRQPIHIPKILKESKSNEMYKKILTGSDHEKERGIIYGKAIKARGMADLLLPHLCGYELQKYKTTRTKKILPKNKAA